MKIISWNCRGSFRLKWSFIEKGNEDVDLYIIQEVEEPANWISQLSIPNENYVYLAFDGDKKGILAYSRKHKVKNDNENEEEDRLEDLNMRYFLPITCNQKKFLCIWTKDHYVADINTYCQVNKDKLADRIFIGDFNANVSHDGELLVRKYRGMNALVDWFDKNGFISCYHHETNEVFGKEKEKTYWFPSIKRNYEKHIDYCFVPSSPEYIGYDSFEIGKDLVHDNWEQGLLSCDHYPLVLTIRD